MAMSAAVQEAYARAHTATVQIFAVELNHSAFPGTIRLVNFEKDLLLGGNNYIGLGMRVSEPEIGTEADSYFRLQIDGVPGLVQPYIVDANKSFEAIEATLRVYAYDLDADALVDTAPLATYNMQARDFSLNMTTVSIELGYTNTANRAFPSLLYTPETNPGLV